MTKIDGTTVDHVKDLDLVMRMCNLIEHSSNYSETTRIVCLYSKVEATKFNANIANDNTFESFMYKAKCLENTEADGGNEHLKTATIAVP